MSVLRLALFCAVVVLCGCATLERGTSVSWAVVERTSMADRCVRLRLRFAPEQAGLRLDRNAACLDRCCWVYGDTPTVVTLDFNNSVRREFGETGNTVVFHPGTVKITLRNFLNTGYLRAQAEPAVVSADGTVALDYEGMFGKKTKLLEKD